MRNKQLFQILTHVLVAVVTATVTVALILFTGAESPQRSKLQQLEDLILDRFVDGAEAKELEDAAANGMVESLGDRWSYYLTAEEYKTALEQRKNAYVGIGVTIDAQNTQNGLTVLEVAKGGPAEKAGMLPGDVIVGVSGQNIVGMDTADVQAMIKGKEGTVVSLTVRRSDEEQTITVTRATVKTPVATGQLLSGGIGLVTIENFNDNCAVETKAAIAQVLEQGAKKLVFDVRNNPGGAVTELVSLLDHLLPEGVLFRSVDHKGTESIEESDEACLELPMAVLVNGSSYSAAEFFAAALSEYDWAVVVGEQTSGKGNYQMLFPLADGSAVGLSVGKYYTPEGKHLQNVGILPDVVVPVDEQTAAAIYAGILEPEDDPQLQSAIKALNGK